MLHPAPTALAVHIYIVTNQGRSLRPARRAHGVVCGYAIAEYQRAPSLETLRCYKLRAHRSTNEEVKRAEVGKSVYFQFLEEIADVGGVAVPVATDARVYDDVLEDQHKQVRLIRQCIGGIPSVPGPQLAQGPGRIGVGVPRCKFQPEIEPCCRWSSEPDGFANPFVAARFEIPCGGTVVFRQPSLFWINFRSVATAQSLYACSDFRGRPPLRPFSRELAVLAEFWGGKPQWSGKRLKPRSRNVQAVEGYKILYNHCMMTPKPVEFCGSSLDDLRSFPLTAKREAGHQIDQVQRGQEPNDWKPMNSVGQGVREIRIRDAAGAFRIIYVAKFADTIYVLHCFQKKTHKTGKPDLSVAIKRYQDLRKELES